MIDDIKPAQPKKQVEDVAPKPVTVPPETKEIQTARVETKPEDVDAALLLQQVETEHTMNAPAATKPPYGLIVVTVVVVVIISIASWFVLQVQL